MKRNDVIPFTLKNTDGNKVQYGLSYSPNGTVELFLFNKRKPREGRAMINLPDGDGVGEWTWTKTYISAETAAKRLLAMGMAGVYATSVDDFMAKVDAAADRVVSGLQPEDTKTSHVRIYQETKKMILASCADSGKSSADAIHEAVCLWLQG